MRNKPVVACQFVHSRVVIPAIRMTASANAPLAPNSRLNCAIGGSVITTKLRGRASSPGRLWSKSVRDLEVLRPEADRIRQFVLDAALEKWDDDSGKTIH